MLFFVFSIVKLDLPYEQNNMRDIDFYKPVPIFEGNKDQLLSKTKPITVPPAFENGIVSAKMDMKTVNTRMLALDRARVRYMHHSTNNFAMIAVPIRSLDSNLPKFIDNGMTSNFMEEDKSNSSTKGEDEITQNESKSGTGCEVELELDIILPDSIDGLSAVEVNKLQEYSTFI